MAHLIIKPENLVRTRDDVVELPDRRIPQLIRYQGNMRALERRFETMSHRSLNAVFTLSYNDIFVNTH